jgi:hypothetical protein
MPSLSDEELNTLTENLLQKANSRRGWLAQLGLAALVAGGVGSGSGMFVGTLSKAEAQQLAQEQARAEVARSDRIARLEAEVDEQGQHDEDQEHQLECMKEDLKTIDRNVRALMIYQRTKDPNAPKPETPKSHVRRSD